MLKQAIRNALHRLLSSGHMLSNFQDVDAIKLANLLQILLPAASKDLLESFAYRVLEAAVDIKMAAMEEKALYQAFWIKHSQKYDDQRMRTLAERLPQGDVLLCIFPGLERCDAQHGQITLLKIMLL